MIIRLLLDHGIEFHASDVDDVLPWAVMAGNQEAVRTLLSNNVDTNNGGAYVVPLLLATRRADMSMANLFLEGGTDNNAQDAEGRSA
jgi:ankyrin repeat protein